MPVTCGRDKEGCYCRWGSSGAKYRYECGNKQGHAQAKGKAEKQGRAVRASQNKSG